ncbi:putative holin-like toxin [Sedimentibacter sp.]|uniref:putative holin-like toxin n=1 Tax=Sedimentibacter sp. TaxID=1960295 RepID=UPI0037DA1F71
MKGGNSLHKEVKLMSAYQAISLMIAFAILVLAIDRQKNQKPCSRQGNYNYKILIISYADYLFILYIYYHI